MESTRDEEYVKYYAEQSIILNEYHKKLRTWGKKTKLTWEGLEKEKEEFGKCCKILNDKMNLLTNQECSFLLHKVYGDNYAPFPNEKTKDAFYYSDMVGMMEQKIMSEGIDFYLVQIEKTKFIGTELGVKDFEEKLEIEKLKRSKKSRRV